MSKKIFLRFVSIFLLIVISFSFYDEINIYNVMKENTKVQAEIIKMPNCCNCRNIIATFKYKDRTFESNVSYNFCNIYKVGDKILFYHNKKHPNIFVSKLYEENSSSLQLISSIILILFFIFILVTTFK